MKRILAAVLCLLLLAGCGEEKQTPTEEGPPAGKMTLPESAYTGDDAGECDCTMTMEWEEYDPSVDTVWYILKNESGQEVEVGEEVRLETLGENDTWYQVPLAENAAWNAVAYGILAGEQLALPCSFSVFDYDFSGGGKFRIVKEVEGQTCAASFTLKAGAAVSAERPYGVIPLEQLPEDYNAGAGVKDGCRVETDDYAENLWAIDDFLEKVRLGIPCQLRTVQDYNENSPVIIDTTYENGCFLWRMRHDGETMERRFSYLVTDPEGECVYLSNGADWDAGERYGDHRTLLTSAGRPWHLVEDMTASRLAANTARYKAWSDDGEWSAALTEKPTEFIVSGPNGGRVCDLRDYELTNGLTSIQNLGWSTNHENILVITGNESGLGPGRHKNIVYYDVEKLNVLDILTPGS